MNKREEDNFVMERLDRAFGSVEWVNKYPLYSLRNLPIVKFDHRPIILDLEVQTPFRRRPFRFEFMWLTHAGCKEMVQNAGGCQSIGSRATQLRNKLLNIKYKDLEWNKKVFGKVEVEIKRKQIKLQTLQDSIATNEDVRRERVCREELEELLDKEELMWAQKARTNWILHSDRNTRYFQIVVRQRRSKNKILQIKDERGVLTDNPEEIENIFLDSFKRNYSGSSNLTVDNILHELQGLPIPTFSEQHLQFLNMGISDREIKEAMFQMGPYKALGPDGILVCFFQ